MDIRRRRVLVRDPLVRALRAVGVALVVAVVVGGCSWEGGVINGNASAGSVEEQFERLMQRPDIDEALEVWERLLEEIRVALRQELDLPEWQFREDRIGGAGCGFDFPDIGGDASTRTISGGSSRAPIPDERWVDALAVVGRIADRYGFTTVERVIDQPGDRHYVFRDSVGTRLTFSTKLATVLGLSSGCHLTAEAKRRGYPTPPRFGS